MSDEQAPAAPAEPSKSPEPVPVEERAKALYYAGDHTPEGKPVQFVTGIPARDLTELDIRVLSDAAYRTALASNLYRKSKPKGGTAEKGA